MFPNVSTRDQTHHRTNFGLFFVPCKIQHQFMVCTGTVDPAIPLAAEKLSVLKLEPGYVKTVVKGITDHKLSA